MYMQLGKEQLLDALRFGADKVFRSKDTSITDADIDAIMEHGKVRACRIFCCGAFHILFRISHVFYVMEHDE